MIKHWLMQCVVKTAHRLCRFLHSERYSVSPALCSVRNNQHSGTANARRHMNEHARFEVFTEVLLRLQVLPDVTLYRCVGGCRYFARSSALVPVKNHSPSDKTSHPRNMNSQGTNTGRGVFWRYEPLFSGVRFEFRPKYQASWQAFRRFPHFLHGECWDGTVTPLGHDCLLTNLVHSITHWSSHDRRYYEILTKS